MDLPQLENVIIDIDGDGDAPLNLALIVLPAVLQAPKLRSYTVKLHDYDLNVQQFDWRSSVNSLRTLYHLAETHHDPLVRIQIDPIDWHDVDLKMSEWPISIGFDEMVMAGQLQFECLFYP